MEKDGADTGSSENTRVLQARDAVLRTYLFITAHLYSWYFPPRSDRICTVNAPS